MRRHVITVAVATAIAGAWAIVYLAGAGALPSFSASYDLEVRVPTAASLATGSKVTIAGLRAGRVTSVERATGGGAVIGLELDDKYRPVPVDSTAALRLHSLVGETYVEIEPGSARAELPEGATVRLQQDSEYVDSDQILSVLRGGVRRRARALVQGLGGGLRNRGAKLNRIVGGVSDTFDAGADMMQTLRADHERIARLVDNVGLVAATIGERGESVRALGRGLRTSLAAIASRDDALRQMLALLPTTLDRVRTTSLTLSRVSRHAGPELLRLADAVGSLRPAIALLRPAARAGRSAVDEIGRAASPLRETLAALRRLSRPAAAALPQVHAALCEVNPALRYLSPYAREIPAVLTNMASTSNYYDANGHAGRLLAMVGENSLVGWSEPLSQAANQLLHAGLLAKVRHRGFNPYPKPGRAGEVVDGAGVAPGPSARKQLRYERVEADC